MDLSSVLFPTPLGPIMLVMPPLPVSKLRLLIIGLLSIEIQRFLICFLSFSSKFALDSFLGQFDGSVQICRGPERITPLDSQDRFLENSITWPPDGQERAHLRGRAAAVAA